MSYSSFSKESPFVSRSALALLCLLSLVTLSSCKSLDSKEEAALRQRLQDFDQERSRAVQHLAVPDAEASRADYLRYALLKHPAVYASYLEWRASVASIAPTKTLPDPQLNFQADIDGGMLMSLMPGVMFDLMLPGKRAAMGREATMGGELAYRDLLLSAVRVANEVDKSLLDLAFVEETLGLKREALANYEQAGRVAAAEYQTGSGMATLEAQLRFTNEVERLRSEMLTWEDRLQAARAQFKASLGLLPEEPSPAWPHPRLTPTALPSEEQLWKSIQTHNAELGKMRAMVDMALAQEEIARQSRRPDFTAGIMPDLQKAPWMWRPTATMTLPIWRGKLQGLVAAAQARREAAVAKVDADLLNMSADLARMLAMIKEADRMIAYIDTAALPSARRTLASAQASLQSGMGKASMIPEARSMDISMRTERVAALRERELAVAELALMTAQISADSGLSHFKQN